MQFHKAKRWIYVITGFRQTQATRTRMVELWKQLHDEQASSDTVVALKPWNAKWEDEAQLVFWMSEHCPQVQVFAYSWGAGWGFTQLAKELLARGLTVKTAVLSDPVYRHGYLAGQWRALFKNWAIKIPPNVGEVYSFYQRQNWPCGHVLKPQGTHTLIHPPVKVAAAHDAMDDHADFLDLCVQQARKGSDR